MLDYFEVTDMNHKLFMETKARIDAERKRTEERRNASRRNSGTSGSISGSVLDSTVVFGGFDTYSDSSSSSDCSSSSYDSSSSGSDYSSGSCDF